MFKDFFLPSLQSLLALFFLSTNREITETRNFLLNNNNLEINLFRLKSFSKKFMSLRTRWIKRIRHLSWLTYLIEKNCKKTFVFCQDKFESLKIYGLEQLSNKSPALLVRMKLSLFPAMEKCCRKDVKIGV